MAKRATMRPTGPVRLQARHFQFIASVIADWNKGIRGYDAHRASIADRFADACAAAYSGGYGFKRDLFLRACGVVPEPPPVRLLPAPRNLRKPASRMTPGAARVILDDMHMTSVDDFHKLTSVDVERLLSVADAWSYRVPKNANGSRARYWFAYLKRRAAKAG